uniref:Maquette 2-1ip n=1 Tax=synthetic construct TaxID=32630 RepID=UPI001AD9513A|nr:Chain A, Maquette 2-1ip [synthetic construct]
SEFEKLRQTGDELVQAEQRLREIFDKGDDDSLEQVLEEIEELIQKHRQLFDNRQEAADTEAAKQGDQWVQLKQRFREAIDKGDKDSLEQLLEELEQALQKIRELAEKKN